MVVGSPARFSRTTMLCVCSKASDALLDNVLGQFSATVIHDARIAARKASLGSYDVYLAYDPRSGRAAFQLWDAVRAFDRNTPFVIVCGDDYPNEALARTRRHYDAVVHAPCDASALIGDIARMVKISEDRGLAARAEEARAIASDLTVRLSALEMRVNLSRQSLARAQEHVMRAYALRAFVAAGGSRANFDRHWPQDFEAMLRASYPNVRSTPSPQGRAGQR